jgi:hypothetical protein
MRTSKLINDEAYTILKRPLNKMLSTPPRIILSCGQHIQQPNPQPAAVFRNTPFSFGDGLNGAELRKIMETLVSSSMSLIGRPHARVAINLNQMDPSSKGRTFMGRAEADLANQFIRHAGRYLTRIIDATRAANPI